MNAKRGGTLVEVMMACVVLSAIALAGGAYIYHTMETLAFHRDRCVAVAKATSVMEELRAVGYRSLTQQMVTTPYTVMTNNARATLEFWSVPELGIAGTGKEAVRITVQVTNHPPDTVSVMTIYSQEWH